MTEKTVRAVVAGDFHFELKKGDDGSFRCLRSDISDPARTPEEVRDMRDIPQQVFSIFNGLMY